MRRFKYPKRVHIYEYVWVTAERRETRVPNPSASAWPWCAQGILKAIYVKPLEEVGGYTQF